VLKLPLLKLEVLCEEPDAEFALGLNSAFRYV
jgi:hypothetical protein